MYLVVSGTNRPQSNTLKVARHYLHLLEALNQPCQLLSLEGLPVLERNAIFENVEKDLLIPSRKYIFVAPEYNGSIPGVLKCLFDISDIRKVWPGKKALLTGVSTGRAGNLRGLDHLTGILHFLGVVVHPNKLPISVVDKQINAAGEIADPPTRKAITSQLDEFLNF